jgi:hypothetical protein
MKVQVGLVMIAAGQSNVDYSILLKKRGDFSYELPQLPLPDDKCGISIVREIIKQCTGIAAKWIEFTPKQAGVFDDVDRNPEEREIFVTYSLLIPSKIQVGKDYTWARIDTLHNYRFYLDNENIIRHTILGGL